MSVCTMWRHLTVRTSWTTYVSVLLLTAALAHSGTSTPPQDSHHHHQTETEVFLQSLFNKYGENGLMTFEGFEHLLQSLGIGNVNIRDHDLRAHRTNGSFVTFHGDHNHSLVTPQRLSDNHSDHRHVGDRKGHKDNDYEHEDSHRHGETHETDTDSDRHNTHLGEEHRESSREHGHDRGHDASSHGNQGNTRSYGQTVTHDPSTTLPTHSPDVRHSGLEPVRTNIHKGNHTSTRHHHHSHHDNDTSTNPSERHLHSRHHQANKNKKRMHHNNNEVVAQTGSGTLPATTPGGRPRVSPGRPGETPGREARFRRELSAPEGHQPRNCRDEHCDQHPAGGPGQERLRTDGQPRIDKCMTATEILAAFHVHYEEGITQDTFLSLCPAIVYQIDRHACHGPPHTHENRAYVTVTRPALHGYADPKVWGYALAAVTVISLVGLLSVALVPVLQKAFYQHLIQFLVALAVGSLTGDALLHLIPHALGSGHEDEGQGHDHGPADNAPVWKGMLVLSGMYFFFLMERSMAGYQQWNAARRKNKQFTRRKPRRSSEDKPRRQSWRFSAIGQKLCEYNKVAFSRDNMEVSQEEAKFIEETLELKDMNALTQGLSHVEGHSHAEGHSHSQGHSHGHGHSHDGAVPSSVAAIAWLVIAGDGLHNFSDGLAIGAGFANSLTGGLSTSVAVFCHELPHELGDFAVLLQSGMSVRQALFYNVVSSVLCLLGMVIGIVVGNIGEASLWIFAMTAGTFIYISLVDMLPEVNTEAAVTTPAKLCMVLLQVLGVSIGVGTMLVIALFEHKIKIDVST